MTSEEPSGPSAAKLGGYTLIGVGAVAAVIGATTAFSGGEQGAGTPSPAVASPPEQGPQQPAPPQPVPNQPAPQQPVPQQPAQPPVQQPPAQQPAGPPPVRLAPSPGGPTGGGPAGGGPAQSPVVGGQPAQPGSPEQGQRISVRVYNNSTTKGLAHRAADDFRNAGYDVPEAGNYPFGKIATTTVYYRPGTPEQSQAEEIAAKFGARAEARFEGLQDATPGVIAIITDDYKGPQPTK